MNYLTIPQNNFQKLVEPKQMKDIRGGFGSGSPLILVLLAACGGGGNSGSSLESGPSSVLAVAGPFYISDPSVAYQPNSQIIGTDKSEVFLGNFGEASINAGHGDNSLFVDGRIFLSGSGNDLVEINGSAFVSLDVGDGHNLVNIIDSGSLNTVVTGSGNDWISFDETAEAKVGEVHISSGAGDDRIEISMRHNLTVTTGAGNDVVQIYQPFGSDNVLTITDFDGTNDALLFTPTVIEQDQIGDDAHIVLADNNRVVLLDATVGQVRFVPELTGTANNDVIEATSQAHLIFGAGGDDTLYGQEGSVTLIGGEGNDSLYGGDGHDSLFGSVGADTLFGGDGSDRLDGGNGNDEIYGDAHNDLLAGGLGHDDLYGGDGNDILNGGEGRDNLFGGEGNDLLIGAAGFDYLTGGEGADIFVLEKDYFGSAAEASANQDYILDYNSSQDIIRLSGFSREEGGDSLTIAIDGQGTQIRYLDTTIVTLLDFVDSGFDLSQVLIDA